MNHDLAVKLEACEKYLLGELSAEMRDAFEDHFFSCADCAVQLRSAAEFIGASQQVLPYITPSAAREREKPEPNRWWRKLLPVIAVPAFAALLLFAGYQNLITIPQLKTKTVTAKQTSQVLQMFSLISGNTKGETVPTLTVAPDTTVGLYVEAPADPEYSTYLLRLQDPEGNIRTLRSLSYAAAQKTQVITVEPGTTAGNYALLISGKGHGDSSPAVELARIQFTIAFSSQVKQD